MEGVCDRGFRTMEVIHGDTIYYDKHKSRSDEAIKQIN